MRLEEQKKNVQTGGVCSPLTGVPLMMALHRLKKQIPSACDNIRVSKKCCNRAIEEYNERFCEGHYFDSHFMSQTDS